MIPRQVHPLRNELKIELNDKKKERNLTKIHKTKQRIISIIIKKNYKLYS